MIGVRAPSRSCAIPSSIHWAMASTVPPVSGNGAKYPCWRPAMYARVANALILQSPTNSSSPGDSPASIRLMIGMERPSSARSPESTSVAKGIPSGSSAPIITLICGRVGSSLLCPNCTSPPSATSCAPETVVASQRITSWDNAYTSMLHACKSCSIACQYLALLKWVRRWPNRSSLKSSGAIRWPLRQLRVFCMPLMYAATVTFRWSPSVRIYASQITAVQPQLSCRCFQCRGRCRSSTSTKPILTICPMSRATSSTRSVIITKSLCPRIVLACCASCTRMESSSPTLKLCGKEHSHCTPWAQRTVDPKLSLPKIQLLDFLYGEWGDEERGNHVSSGNCCWTYSLNLTGPPWNNKLVRQAANYAIDRE